MPILFGPRRQSTPAPPLTWETAAPDAANAAASAFRRREATLSLSSSAAAAAAALRARPMTSTNVSSVQPKRAVGHRRSPSVSSLIGRERLARRDIHRSPSVCSMVERSFRTPSPGGQSPMPVASDAPPVPKLPKAEVAAEKKSKKATEFKASDGAPPLQTQHFRTASQRVKDGRLGSWFGGATTRDGSNTRKRSSSVTVTGSGAFDGRASGANVDARPESVVGAKSVSDDTAPPKAVNDKPVPEVSSRRLLPRRQLLGRSQSVRESAEKPRRVKQDLSRAGSHLSRGTTDRTQAPTLQSLRSSPTREEAPAVTSAPQSTESTELTKKTKKKKKKKSMSKTRQGEAPAETPVPVEEQTAPGDSQMSLGEPTPPLSDKPPVLELAFQFSGDEGAQQPEVKTDQVTTDGTVNGRAKSPPAAKRQGRARVAAREPSESPARSARFARTTTQPLIMHEPPPRSVSPMKSALKHLQPKDSLVSDDSDMSDREPSADRQEEKDTAVAPKKSARVSWDDHTLVVAEADGSEDKETKKPRLSVLPNDAKEQQTSVGEDETMSPRPALPLFGSVRDKKSRDLEERPLVRPAERTWSHSAASDTKPTADRVDPTSEAAQEQEASRNAANISKYREPLPAVSSRAEGGVVAKDDGNDGKVSDDDDLESDAETEKGLVLDATPAADLRLQKASPLVAAEDRGDGSVPTTSAGSDAGHADEEGVESDAASLASTEEDPTRLTAARPGEAPLGPNSPLMEDIQEEDDETDRCSVYSDACEVLSPMESIEDGLHSSAGGVVDRGSSVKQAGLRSPNDWENAKSYWKSLTPDQRRQLEVEALEEDGDDHLQSPPGSSKRSTSSTKETGSERSYQIKPGTRWEEQPPPVPPKPGMMVKQSPPATAQPKAVPIQTVPEIPQPNSIELPRSAVRSRSEQSALGARRTMRIGSFEAVWEPKYVEGAQYGPFAKFIKGGGNKSSSETTSPTGTQSAEKSTVRERRNRSVDETASQAMMAERRGSDGSVGSSSSSFRRSRVMPLAVNNSAGMRSWMKEQQNQQEAEETVSRLSPRSLQPNQGDDGSAPTMTTTTAATTTTTTAPPAVSASSDGGYLRQSLRGETAPASVLGAAPAPLSPGRRRSATRRTRKGRKDSRLADSSDSEDGGGGGSSQFHSRFDDSSDSDSDSDETGRRPRPRAKGMARTMRGEANKRSSAVSPPTRASSDPGSPAPGWKRESLPPPPSRSRFASSTRPTTSSRRRRGSFMSMFFRKMREGGSSSSGFNNASNNDMAHSPVAEDGRSGRSSGGSSARQVLSAARRVLSPPSSSSSPDRPRPSTASAPSRTRQLLVRRNNDVSQYEAGSDVGRQPRRKFAALRRMLGFYE